MIWTGLALGACCSAAALVTLTRVVGFKWILKHATVVDVGVTVGLGALFVGSSVGMIVAIVGGLITALFLTACVWLDGQARKLRGMLGRRKRCPCCEAKAQVASKAGSPAPNYPVLIEKKGKRYV